MGFSFAPSLRLSLKRASVYTWDAIRLSNTGWCNRQHRNLYDMEEFFEMSVQKYRDNIGKHVKLKDAKTPSLPEDAKDHPARRPYTDGKQVECTWCKHTFNPDVPLIPGGADESDEQTIAQGELASHAASVLLKLLYAARLAPFGTTNACLTQCQGPIASIFTSVDACMESLNSNGGGGRAIKTPWSFLSWNLGKPKNLELKCECSHEHAPCAGRETKGTEVYSPSLCRRLVEYCMHSFKTCRQFEGIYEATDWFKNHISNPIIKIALCAIRVQSRIGARGALLSDGIEQAWKGPFNGLSLQVSSKEDRVKGEPLHLRIRSDIQSRTV